MAAMPPRADAPRSPAPDPYAFGDLTTETARRAYEDMLALAGMGGAATRSMLPESVNQYVPDWLAQGGDYGLAGLTGLLGLAETGAGAVGEGVEAAQRGLGMDGRYAPGGSARALQADLMGMLEGSGFAPEGRMVAGLADAAGPQVRAGLMDFGPSEYGGVNLPLTRENAPLIGHHNLSPKGVEVSSSIGGIPMPSMAISRADYPLTNFGDITLLAKPGMVSPPRNTGVWPTDVYTGRQPRGELQFSSEKAATAAMKADPNFGHMRDISYWMGSTNSFDDANRMMQTAQLGARAGIDPKAYSGMFDYVRDVEAKLGYSAFEDAPSMPGFEAYGGVERVLYPKEMFTQSGNRRKPVPYTLGSVMDRMSKERAYTAGSEGWDYGPASFRAIVTPPFKSMNEIQAARGSIVTPDQMKETKDAFANAYGTILNDVNAAYRGRGYADGTEAMRELAQGKNPTWFGDIPAQTRQDVRSLAEITRGLPTEYFEAKPRTAYQLGDFPAAIVPEGDIASADALRSAGVRQVLTYGTPEERVALFRRFPDLLFSGAAMGAPLGLLAMQPEQEQY
jgi:hypothetical protein